MHLPPAAAWTAGATRWQRGVVAILALLGLLIAYSFGAKQGWAASTAWLSLILVACTVFSTLGLRQPVTGQLRWDGEQWHWSGLAEHTVTKIRCVLDLQRLLLLQVHCDQGASLWLWMECSTRDAAWMAFRRALVSSRNGISQSVDLGTLR
jgi:toxin CptA